MESFIRSIDNQLKKDQHPFGFSLLLHFIPAILATILFFIISRWFYQANIPTILALHIALLSLIIPIEFGLVRFSTTLVEKNYDSRNFFAFKHPILKNTTDNKKSITIGLSIIAVIWVVLIMGILDNSLSISDWILNNWFQWLPEHYIIGDIYSNPKNYSIWIRILVIITSFILGAILGPYVEELYFRGYLMSRIGKNNWITPLIHTILFAIYHLWTPWLIPMRILALLPMVYFVWWKKDIKIGIIAHIAVNFVGDVVMVFPSFFF